MIKTNLTSRELAKLFLGFARENKLESKIQANILNTMKPSEIMIYQRL